LKETEKPVKQVRLSLQKPDETKDSQLTVRKF